MKKVLLALLCLTALLLSGCGDKFAKDKEAILKAEKAAMSVQLPELKNLVFSGAKGPTKQEKAEYAEKLKAFVASEEKILEEMKKNDAKIAELVKAANDSEKKDWKAFTDKVRKERVNFVRKISKGRLRGDTFVVGAGSTWQEVEMVYGEPEQKVMGMYEYDGIRFEDRPGGVEALNLLMKKWVSTNVESVRVTGSVVSDAGVKIGMTRDEVYKALKEKAKEKELKISKANNNKKDIDIVTGYAGADTLQYNLQCEFAEGKLVQYTVTGR